jgi:predicted PolB exonuclease-like 3'-5' exonuclease
VENNICALQIYLMTANEKLIHQNKGEYLPYFIQQIIEICHFSLLQKLTAFSQINIEWQVKKICKIIHEK